MAEYDYDIAKAFNRIELDLIDSMKRNMKKHIKDQEKEEIIWSQWQAEMLKGLDSFKKEMKGISFTSINEELEEAIKLAYQYGESEQEAEILKAIKRGYSTEKIIKGRVNAEFFKVNKQKMNALLDETKGSVRKAQVAMLRKAEDEYRKTIFNAQVYFNSGAGTIWKAVDMATKDFLNKGIACVQYKNGNMVNIASYSEMALRTANTRAYLHGSASKRAEYGINTVMVSKHSGACPRCVQYQGRIFVDDVYGDVPSEGPWKYPRLSIAVNGGLFHPNCKDGTSTYYEGISTVPKKHTQQEQAEQIEQYNLEQKQRYHERQIRKYERLSRGALDVENQNKYAAKKAYWQQTNKDFVNQHKDKLVRDPEREKLRFLNPFGTGNAPEANVAKLEKGDTIKSWHDYKYTGTTYTTKKQVSERLQEFGIDFKDSKKYPIHQDVINEGMQFLDKFADRFPGFMSNQTVKLPVINVKPPSQIKGAMGYYSYYTNSPRAIELSLNGEFMSNLDKWQAYIDRTKGDWSVANATIGKTFVHEYGHHVSNSLRWITEDPAFESKFLKECITEFKKDNDYKYNTFVGMGEHVGRYAATKECELFAETFAEYFGGKNPRAFAKIFGEKLEKILNEVK